MASEDGHPRAGRDYPRDWHELLTWFPDEAACSAYLERLRWPEGFVCPACGERDGWRTGRGLLLCAHCRHATSATAGTIFEGTRTPLQTWFAACWYVTSQKHGASALGLKQALSLGSYQTAWAMLHRLRRAMVRPGRERLSGVVEVDESYVGGEEEDVSGRETDDKAIVAIACELRHPHGFGRVRLRHVADVSAASLVPFVREAVEPGAIVNTDGWGGYNGLAAAGYAHTRTVISATGDPAHVSMPAVHRVASLLKRWLLGTHQGAVSNEHLDLYLQEFTFRFNRRSSRRRGLLFYRLLEQAVATAPAPYRALIAKHRQPQDVVVG
jgi:transposase-like protein